MCPVCEKNVFLHLASVPGITRIAQISENQRVPDRAFSRIRGRTS